MEHEWLMMWQLSTTVYKINTAGLKMSDDKMTENDKANSVDCQAVSVRGLRHEQIGAMNPLNPGL